MLSPMGINTLGATGRPSSADAGLASNISAVSVFEAARLIGVGHSTTKTLCRNGALRSFTVGRRRLVTLAAIADYIGRREAENIHE